MEVIKAVVTVIRLLFYIVFFPLFVPYWALKSQAGKLAKSIVVLIGLVLMAIWVITISAFLTPSKTAKTPKKQTIQESLQPSPTVEFSSTATPASTKQVISQRVKVTRVIDGDTIEIETGKRVRYIGINALESGCFANEATDKNKKLVGGKEVRLEKDISETDKYGRLLRYVYVDNLFVNDYLVRNGYAHTATYPPDVKYQN